MDSLNAKLYHLKNVKDHANMRAQLVMVRWHHGLEEMAIINPIANRFSLDFKKLCLISNINVNG